jgi:MoxR-like ATPase
VTPDRIREGFAERGYIASDDFATALELTLALQKPLLIEGPAGVGKTESAKVLADVLGTRLIRLQCYEGLDAASALYEWNYPKQLLRIRLTEDSGASAEARETEVFSEPYLLKRPLLEAITQERAPVLLIDEIDRADEAFEAFLLELLGEFQVTIPELGTIRARERPAVIITSNRLRELSDALRRRCLYLWIDYPTREQELQILHARLPGIDARLADQIARFMEHLRAQPFQKVPGVAESLDWALALMRLHRDAIDERTLEQTLGCILKVRDDWNLMRAQRSRYEPLLTGGTGSTANGTPLTEQDYGVGTVRANRG